MAYRIKKKWSVKKNVRSIAREQIKNAIKEIRDRELDSHEVVHQVRKRCKKLRGLIRLVRPQFKRYSEENRFLRDAARELSGIRDAQTMIDTIDALSDHYRPRTDIEVFRPVRKELVARRQKITENSADLERRVADFERRMLQILRRIDDWKIRDEDFSSVAGGLLKTYRRCRKAFVKACKKPTTENLHEWRKRVKYHWYHIRLLRGIWPDVLKARETAADRLADLLGDEHDLAVLRQTLLEGGKQFGSKRQRLEVKALIDRRREELRTEAMQLGRYLLAEKPSQLAERFGVYWSTWKGDLSLKPFNR